MGKLQYFLITTFFLSGACNRFDSLLPYSWALEVDQPTQYVTAGVVDTLRFKTGPTPEDFAKEGGYVQLCPYVRDQLTIVGTGDDWIAVVINNGALVNAKLVMLLDGYSRSVEIKFIVSPGKIIYARKPLSGQNDIFTCNSDGGNITNLTNTSTRNEHSPTLSASGTMHGYIDSKKYVIVKHLTDTIYNTTISTYPQNLHFVRDESGFFVLEDIQYGPQYRRISGYQYPYLPYISTPGYERWFINANSVEENSNQDYVCIETDSPLYINNNPSSSSNYTLWDHEGPDFTTITQCNQPSTISYAEISPNNRYIVFSASQGNQHTIYLVDRINPTVAIPLTDGTSDCDHPSFNAACNRIIYSGKNGTNYDLFTMDLNGNNVTNITSTSTYDETEPQWR